MNDMNIEKTDYRIKIALLLSNNYVLLMRLILKLLINVSFLEMSIFEQIPTITYKILIYTLSTIHCTQLNTMSFSKSCREQIS